MLNVIKSVVVTFVSVILSVVSFIKGPLLVGLIVGASIMAFANKAEASTRVNGTQAEMKQAEKNVAKGIYINDAGVRVSKPSSYICNMYRNTYSHYTNMYGADKGSLVWVIITIRRGC